MAFVQKYKEELKIKKRKRFLARSFFILLLVVVGFGAAAYGLFFAGIFDIRNVNLDASGELNPVLNSAINDRLNAKFLGILRRNNIIFFSVENFSAQLTRQFPVLDSIKIDKEFWHGLKISVIQRKPAGIWCLPADAERGQGPAKTGNCFYFDKNAVAYARASKSAGFLISIISDYRGREITLGSPVVSDEWFKNIISAKELLSRVGVNVSGFVIPADSFDEFDAKTAEGWKIMFSNSTNVEEQISALAGFLKNKMNPAQKAGLQYVDLRIQDRIYYK